jgi:hypothetical protein
MVKSTQIYDWDSEPVDERPSEFMEYTPVGKLSGYSARNDPMQSRNRRSRIGFKWMLAFCVAVIAIGGWAAAHVLAPLLQR